MAHDLLDAPDDSFDLEVAPAPEPVKTEGALAQVPAPSSDELLRLSNNASSWVSKVAALPPQSLEFKQEVDAIFEVGSDAFRETSATSSRFLEQSLATSKSGGAQEQVSRSLVDLRNEVDELAPGEDTFAERLLGALPFSNRVKRYFKRYESNQQQLNSILVSLNKGQDLLRKDNAALNVERRSLWGNLGTLKRAYELLTSIDDELVARIGRSARRVTPTLRPPSRGTRSLPCASAGRTCRRRPPSPYRRISRWALSSRTTTSSSEASSAPRPPR